MSSNARLKNEPRPLNQQDDKPLSLVREATAEPDQKNISNLLHKEEWCCNRATD